MHHCLIIQHAQGKAGCWVRMENVVERQEWQASPRKFRMKL
jgi:hypothetical protein